MPGKGFGAEVAREWLYAFAIQSLDYALLAVDTDRRILWANPGAGWILAALQTEIVGQTITQFFTPEDRATGIPEHEQHTALRQGSSDDDRWMLRADGSRFWASGKTIALSRNDGTAMGYMKIFRDQTEFKMRLDTTRAVPATVSVDGTPTAGSPVVRERLSLRDELQAAIAIAAQRVAAGGRSIELLLPDGVAIEIEGDRDRLRLAFATLIENAIRATDADGHVWVNGTTEDRVAAVRVEDNGRGIAPDMLAVLYELFTRPPAQVLEGGGSFSLVRRIAAEHAGTVQVLSEGVGKGSAFILRLPLRSPRAEPSP